MFCKHCGKELDEEDLFCPYCGTEQSCREKTASPAPEGRLPRKVITGIALAAAAVFVAAIIAAGVSSSGSGRDASSGSAQVFIRPRLSEANVAAGEEAVAIVDKYLDTFGSLDDFLYGSDAAAADLLEVENSMVEESDAATEEIRLELTGYIDQIIDELSLNEKSLSNAARVFLEGGETADRELIESCRDEISKLLKKYS